MSQIDYTLKQIAEMKKEFLNSEFGKFAAERINGMYGQHHAEAETAATPYEKATHVDKAAGISEVISFFTNDVALLEAGVLDGPKEAEKA